MVSDPGLGAAGGGRGPLAGIRVLELGGIGPGPFCAMMLANSGATILRIDRPSAGDPPSAGEQPGAGEQPEPDPPAGPASPPCSTCETPARWTRCCGWSSAPTCCSRASVPA